MRRVAVIGVGMTKFGKHDRSSAELFAEAAADAIVDADIAASRVESLYFGNVTGGVLMVTPRTEGSCTFGPGLLFSSPARHALVERGQVP